MPSFIDLVCFLPKYSKSINEKVLGETFQIPSFDSFDNHKGRISQDSESVVKIEVPHEDHHISKSGIHSRHCYPSGLGESSGSHHADPLNPPVKLSPSYNPPKKTICDYMPVFRIFRSLWKVSGTCTLYFNLPY